MAVHDSLLAPLKGAEHRDYGSAQLDIVPVGKARVKRLVYPPGFRWSTHIKPLVGTELCMHAHVGCLVRGKVHVEYADGCSVDYEAPDVVQIVPGHDAWVLGDETAVLIEFDFERQTLKALGLPEVHSH
jgi:hypothetical protein